MKLSILLPLFAIAVSGSIAAAAAEANGLSDYPPCAATRTDQCQQVQAHPVARHMAPHRGTHQMARD